MRTADPQWRPSLPYISGDESIKWLWTDARFRVRATGLDATPDASEKWVVAGDSVTFTATPTSGCEITHWDGDAFSSAASITIPAVNDAMDIRVCAMPADYPGAERIVRVSPAGSDASDGSSWAKAFKTPTAALAALAGETKLTYVAVAAGKYSLTSAMNLNGPIRIVGAGAADTVFDGGEGAYRAFTVTHDDAGVYDLTIQRYFPKNVDGGGFYMSKGEMRRCLIKACHCSGNTSSSWDSGHGGGAGIRNDGATVINNTIYGNVQANDATGESGLCQSKGTAVNNIIWGNGPSGQLSCKVSGGTFAKNVIDAALGSFPDNYVSDPKFVDAAAGDFHLSSRSSDAYAQGDPSVAPLTDFDARARKAETPDIGAYEYDMSKEQYGVSLKLAENHALGATVKAEAVITRVDPSTCSIAWSLDGASVQESSAILQLTGLAAGYHKIAVSVNHATYGAAAATNTIAVKPYAVYVNTTGDGTFPYDTAEKGTNALTVAYQALWRDTSHTSVVTVAAGTYSLTDQILQDAPVRIEGAGRDRTFLRKSFANGRCFILSSSGAAVTGLSVTNGTSGGAFSMSQGVIDGCGVLDFKLNGEMVSGVGVAMTGGAVRNCVFDSIGGTGYYVYGVGVRLEGGVVSNSVIRNCRAPTGLYDNYGGAGIHIDGGTFVDSRVECCGVKDGAQAGAAIKLAGYGAIVERCVFSNNFCSTTVGGRNAVAILQSANKASSEARRSVVRNCLFCDNVGCVTVKAGDRWDGSNYPGPIDIVNVTFAANEATASSYCNDGRIVNSILEADGQDWTIADAVAVSNTCCAALVDGVNGNVTGDPLFKKPAKGNFRLRAGSPCLNAGDPSPYAAIPDATDLEGNPRVHKGKVHMGCYQNLNKGLLLMVR